jgi:ech hydrogenase subunit D
MTMTSLCPLENLNGEQLLNRVRALREARYRLVQVGAARFPEHVEVTYTFDLHGALANLRLLLSATEPRLPSISSVYPCVVLYENELHDLFAIEVDGMAVSFQGQLYATAVPFPFGTAPMPPAKPTARPNVVATASSVPGASPAAQPAS